MRKTILLLLVLAMLMSVSVTAYAENNNGNQATSIPVNGVFHAADPAGVVISADITWEEMTFTYTEGAAGAWQTDSHSYAASEQGSWSADTKTITVTNHSNAAITAQLAFDTKVNGLFGTFTESSGTANDSKLELATAVGTGVDSAPTASAQFGVSGAAIDETQTLGTITVTIATGTKNTQPEVNGEPVVLYVTVANTNANTQYHVVSFYDDNKESIKTTSDLSGLNSEVNVPEGAEYFSVEYPLQNDASTETAITKIPEVSSNVTVAANGAITITPRT